MLVIAADSADPGFPPRYQEEGGLALAGEVGGAVGAVASVDAGMRPTTTHGGRKKFM